MHQSIALWSHPRSMSTALERVFIERGDFQVFHESFAYVYFMHEERASIPHKHVDDSHPLTYPDVRDMMERARATSPVFHKDFPYHALEHLSADAGYLLGQVNTFLIRDPREAVLSHATVHPGLTLDVLGYRQLAALFDVVVGLQGTTPLVIDAADLADDPIGTVRAYCDHVGIDFRPEALSWQAGDQPQWSSWKGWHSDVAASNGIARPQRRYEFDPDTQGHLVDFIEYCRPFYEHLKAHRVRPAREEVAA